jgi:hypothetical protein
MSRKELLILFLVIVIGVESYGQMAATFAKLPLAKWSGEWKSFELSDKEKMDRLAFLPEGDSVQFELPNYSSQEEDEPLYFPFNIYGLHYFDLDFDGDLDMVYSGQSGWQTLSDTKVYLLEDNIYELKATLRGGLLDIQKMDNAFEIHTIWVPCCDSYTTRIETHRFSAEEQAVFKESISVIALRHLEGMRSFDNLPTGIIIDADLFASSRDFRGTHPYFRANNRPMNNALRKGEFVSLVKLKGDIKITLLDQKMINDQTWYLVITDAILNTPKSHYEWSDGDHRRLIGWVNQVKFD